MYQVVTFHWTHHIYFCVSHQLLLLQPLLVSRILVLFLLWIPVDAFRHFSVESQEKICTYMDNVSAMYAFSISLWAKLNKKWVSTKGLFDYFVTMFGGFQTFPLHFKQSCMHCRVTHGLRNDSRPKCTKEKSVFRHLERLISKHSFSSYSPCDWLKISTNKKEVMPISLVNFSNAFPRETVFFSSETPPRETKFSSFRRPESH